MTLTKNSNIRVPTVKVTGLIKFFELIIMSIKVNVVKTSNTIKNLASPTL